MCISWHNDSHFVKKRCIIMQTVKKLWSAGWLPVLSVILTCFYPCVFLYAHNAGEAPFSSLFPFFGVFLLNGLIFLVFLSLIQRNISRGAFLTDLSMLVIINFGMVMKALNAHWDALKPGAVLAVLAVLFLVILLLLIRKRPNMRIPCGLFALTFGVLSVVSFGLAVVTNLSSGSSQDNQEAFETYEPKTFTGDKPNVYYFLFDGYAGPECLEHYYHYDNEPFLKAMEDKGFTVSRTSHNYESLKTVTIVPNLLNLDYVAHKDMSVAEKDSLLEMPNLFRTFRDNGYQLNLANHLDYIGSTGCNVLTRNQSRRTISDFLLKNSLYSQFDFIKNELNNYIHADYVATYTGPLFNAMDAERDCWKYTGDGPTFTMGYLQCPHAPTILDKNGNLVDNYENVGWQWDRPELYLGQLEYISSFILELVTTIQEHDPDALIIVQSDHGSRQANHFYDMGIWDTFDPAVENPYMQNNLNCVYYKGEDFPIEGEIGINSLRLILNQVFGTDYEMIEPYHYVTGRFDSHPRDEEHG